MKSDGDRRPAGFFSSKNLSIHSFVFIAEVILDLVYLFDIDAIVLTIFLKS